MAQLTRWQPVHDIDALLDDLERRWTSGFRRILDHGDSVQLVPACEILEGDHDTLMRFDIPGVDPERDLEITVEGDMFCVRGERRHDSTVDSVQPSYVEPSFGRFERCLRLPEGTESGRVRAHYDRGVLDVVLPKMPAAERRRIPVVRVEEASGSSGVV